MSPGTRYGPSKYGPNPYGGQEAGTTSAAAVDTFNITLHLGVGVKRGLQVAQIVSKNLYVCRAIKVALEM